MKKLAVIAAMLAPIGAQAADVKIGGLPIDQLEAHGWERTSKDSWKLELPNGTTYSMHRGKDQLRARLERLLASKKLPSEAAEGSRLSEEIAFLREALAQRHTATKGQSTYTCAGTLAFEPTFYFSMVGGGVDSVVSFTEFGPYAPYWKKMYATAEAWDRNDYAATYQRRVSNSGWFAGTMYKETSAYASVNMTFFPSLRASGYMISTASQCPPYYFTAETASL